jgi:hypothetical protein
MQYEKTINKILTRLSNDILIIEAGDILETQKTIFPKYSQKREEKNIIIDSTEVTPPLACSKEWKKLMLKEKAMLCQIYKDFARGDILRVKDVKGSKIIVENLSIDEEFRKEFEIDRTEIFKKNFNLIKRRSIDLVKSLEKLED